MKLPVRPARPRRREGSRPWTLADGEVHVYRLALERERRVPDARPALLGADETARARRLRIAEKRAEFALTRAALRRVLAAQRTRGPCDRTIARSRPLPRTR